MTLILCEKPSVAKAFADCLKAGYNQGYYKNNKYIITNCLGHLFTLFMPEDYDVKFKAWNLNDLPLIPKKFKYKKNTETAKQADLVIRLLKENKGRRIIIATDAGREGELIARITLMQAGFTSTENMYRFWQSEALTKEVILKGIENAKPLNEYTLLANQGYTRQYSDYLIGINLTRLLSIHSNTLLSVGRVQTAVLHEIYRRETEIKNFIPAPYYEYIAELASSEANLKAKLYVLKSDEPCTRFDRDNIDLSSCINKQAVLKDKQTIQKKENPEKLFNLTALQKEAFKAFGFSPEKTLNIAQSLYEQHKCLSYPRTPSRVMGSADVEFVKKIYNNFKELRREYTGQIDESLFTAANKYVFDDARLEDHHALLPLTEIPDGASKEEKDVFELIVKQFFCCFSRPYICEQTTLLFEIDDFNFVAKGKTVLQKGFKELASNEANLQDDEEENIFNADNLSNLVCKNTECIKKLTKPKQPYRFDSLLSFMENPKAEDENKRLVGLGTPATRAEIIKTLITRKYIAENKKQLVILEKGEFLINQIKKNASLAVLCDVKQTTVWEEKTQNEPVEFFNDIKEFLKTVCKQNVSVSKFEKTKESLGSCPVCKKSIFEGSKNYYCEGYKEGCSFVLWKNIAGASLSKEDIKKLLSKKLTGLKQCKNKEGKKFICKFSLDEENKIKFIFDS